MLRPSQIRIRIVGYHSYNTAGDEWFANNLSPMIISPFKTRGKRVGGMMSTVWVELTNLSPVCSDKNKTTSGNKDELELQVGMQALRLRFSLDFLSPHFFTSQCLWRGQCLNLRSCGREDEIKTFPSKHKDAMISEINLWIINKELWSTYLETIVQQTYFLKEVVFYTSKTQCLPWLCSFTGMWKSLVVTM